MKKYSISRLDWDSDFFGYEVGSLVANNPSDLVSLQQVRNNMEHFQLCYVYSKIPIVNDIHAFEDEKVVFEKKIEKSEASQLDDLIIAGENNFQSLLPLAWSSGAYSRFKLDSSFTNHEFERLYETWLAKSLNRELADKVYVIKHRGEPAGFITLKKKNTTMEIGLIATAEHVRGQGIGSKLIMASIQYAHHNQCNALLVPTQRRNTGALSFYVKNGFREVDTTYIYNVWK